MAQAFDEIALRATYLADVRVRQDAARSCLVIASLAVNAKGAKDGPIAIVNREVNGRLAGLFIDDDDAEVVGPDITGFVGRNQNQWGGNLFTCGGERNALLQTVQ